MNKRYDCAATDRLFGELTTPGQCSGRLRIKDDDIVECCCRRLALEYAYGTNFILRDQLYFVDDGGIPFPDVLPEVLKTDGMSMKNCPFSGASMIMTDIRNE